MEQHKSMNYRPILLEIKIILVKKKKNHILFQYIKAQELTIF